MNAKTLTGLAVTAAVVVGAAMYISKDSGSSAPVVTEAGSGLLPELQDIQRINDVVEIRVQRNDKSYTLKKTGEAWGLSEKGGYPIETSSVRKALLVLRDMKLLEKKTANAERYAQLDLADPKSEGSKAVQVDLLNASGATLASLVIGKQMEQKGSFESNQTYVRRTGDAQCWLVRGKAEFHEDPSSWLDKKIVEVKRDRVATVSIVHPDGERFDIARAPKDVADYTLSDIPEGKEPTYPSAPGSVASALEWVNLEDVAPLASVDFETGAGPTSVFTTFDGLTVTVKTKDQDGKSWARFDVAVAETAEEAVKTEAQTLQKKLAGWAYQISSYSRSNFGKKKAEVLKDKTAATGEANAPADIDGSGVMLPADGGVPPAQPNPASPGSHTHADGTVHDGPPHD
jgi:hypothetical protein